MQLKSLLIAGASAAMVFQASAQNFTYDDSLNPAPGTYQHAMDYVVGNVSFNNFTGPSNPYAVNPVGMKQTRVTLGGGLDVDVWDVCAQIFVGPTGSSTYTVTNGLGASGLSATQQNQLGALYSNALPLFLTARASLSYDEASSFAAAIQMSVWEIAEEIFPSLSLDAADFAALNSFSIDVAGSDTDAFTTEAIDLAIEWVGLIESGDWENSGGISFFYADGGTEQDRIWATFGATTIPEPSVAILGILGGLLLVGRRRR